MNFIKSTLVGFFLVGVSLSASAQTVVGRVGESVRKATPVTCHSVAVSANNIESVRNRIEQALMNHNSEMELAFLQRDFDNTVLGFDMLAGVYARDLKALDILEAGRFSAAAHAKAINIMAGGSDACAAAYSCGGGSIGTSAHCSTCTMVEVSPRTNPRTCVESCAMCCAHFGNPTNCHCDSQEPC